MRSRSVITMLALTILLLSPTQAQVPSTDARLLKPVGNIELRGTLVPDVCIRLAAIAGVPVAVESLDDVSFWGPTSGTKGTRVDLEVAPAATIASVLDAAVAADPRYEWRFTGQWLHVMPRNRAAGYPLDLPCTGTLPAGSRVGPVIRSLTGSYLPESWQVQFVLRRNYPPITRLEEVAAPPTLTLREAIDVVLWRAGVQFWGTRPVHDTSVPSVSTVLEIVL